MKILVLSDFKIGSSKQAIALGSSMSEKVEIKNIVYNKLMFLPNYLKGKIVGVNLEKSDNFLNLEEYPDYVIFSGRRLAGVALTIKKNALAKNQNVKLISILNPNYNFNKFDFVVLPEHDSKKKGDNVISINGSLCGINKENIEKNASCWKENLLREKVYKPYISLFIGGDTNNKILNSEKFGNMIKNLSNIVNNKNYSLLITTTRRTNSDCLRELKRNLKCSYYLYDWKYEQDKPEGEKLLNPYLGFLEMSDIVIVTGDSISMVSEVLSTGKTCYVYTPYEVLGKKHLRFLDNLKYKNYLKEFNYESTSLTRFTYSALNELEKVKNKILG